MKAELEKVKSEGVSPPTTRAYPTPRSSLTRARAASRSPSVSSSLRHSLKPSDDDDDDDAKTERHANSDNEEGTWGSIHAPTRNAYGYGIGNGRPSPPSRLPSTPRPAYAIPTSMPVSQPRKSFKPPAEVSPTLTSVSLAPTQGDDGWWS